MRDPANETYLAAELAYTHKALPAKCAWDARKACALGRRYKRISEKLCGGEEEWGPWSDAVQAAQSKAERARHACRVRLFALLTQYGTTITGDSLLLTATTNGNNTALL